jgi:hypothetical protein
MFLVLLLLAPAAMEVKKNPTAGRQWGLLNPV